MDYYLNGSYISDVTAIDQHGHRIILNEGADSNLIAFLPNGIREANLAPAIRLYPDPAADQVSVVSKTAMNSVRIFDMLGSEVQRIDAGERQVEIINLQLLANGVYIIQVNTLNGTATTKLVVSK